MFSDRQCKKCGETKPITDFRWRVETNKYRGVCRDCCNENERKRYRRAEEKRLKKLEGNRIYRQGNKEQFSLWIGSWNKANKDKIRAMQNLQSAVKRGVLTRPNKCQYCGKECKTEAHHWSYKKEHQLDVAFLCASCHNRKHAALRELIKCKETFERLRLS